MTQTAASPEAPARSDLRRRHLASPRGTGEMRIGLLVVFAIVALEAPVSSAGAQEGASACASITSNSERLMCYDRERCAAIASGAERLACYDRVQGAAAPQA